MLIPSCTVRLEGAWNPWKCVRWAHAGFRENRLIVGVWHGGHSVRAKPPHDRVCVSVNRRGGSAPFTDGPHRRTGSVAGQAGRHVFCVQMPRQLERAAVRYSFGGRTFTGTRGLGEKRLRRYYGMFIEQMLEALRLTSGLLWGRWRPM